MSALVAVTQGDPSGIGIEITLKAWLQKDNLEATFFLISDPDFVKAQANALGLDVPVCRADLRNVRNLFASSLPVLPISHKVAARPGHPDPAFAQSTIVSIEQAVELALNGQVKGIVTNPISKRILYDSGFAHPGHTEYLGHLCSKKQSQSFHPVMMLWCQDLAVIPVTVHVPLKHVPSHLTQDLIIQTAQIAHDDLKQRFHISHPRIAVAGLNPHAGEQGTMGQEEQTIITPAIKKLQHMGLDVKGPYPADTLFHEQARCTYDVALSMYHDQGLIPIKTIAFDRAVNVTLGLPLVRTSPDHGTAFDIAGQNRANPQSLIEAIKLASQMSM